MTRLRVGVAGLGRGRMFVDLFNDIDECEVVAVCDPLEKALQGYGSIAAHRSYEQFLETGLDIVAVITPGPLHAGQAIEAMQAGAHVLCETPCVYSVPEARAVVQACEASGKTFHS